MALEALIYLVFKVQLRQSRTKVAFETMDCQEGVDKKSLKTNAGKGCGDCANLCFQNIGCNSSRVRDWGEKIEQLKKTPTGWRNRPYFLKVTDTFLSLF